MSIVFPSSVTPGTTDSTDGSGYNLYTLFKSNIPIRAGGITFHSPTAQPGAKVCIWNGATNVTSAVVGTVDVAAGDNLFPFSTSVALAANTQYAVGIFLPAPAHWAPKAGVAVLSEDPIFQATGAQFGFHQNTANLVAYSNGGTAGTTWYGLGLSYDIDPLTFTATRTSDTEASLVWSTGDASDKGISILRAPGQETVDGNGHAFGEAGYDPTTIVGSSTLAEGVTTSPYTDSTLVASDTYTYAVIRTGSAS